MQATARFGSMQLAAIAAQQKGIVVRDQVFTIGRRVSQTVEQELEDFQIEPRRFFWVVDPALFGAAYPNIDILNGTDLARLARGLAVTQRPSRVFLYSVLLGASRPILTGRASNCWLILPHHGLVYELFAGAVLLLDPSLLWFAWCFRESRERAPRRRGTLFAWADAIASSPRSAATPYLSHTGAAQLAHLSGIRA